MICPVTDAGLTSLWSFPLDGRARAARGKRAARPRERARRRARSSRSARMAPGGAVELYLERPEGAPRRLTREGAHWHRPLRGVACEQVSIPGPAGPIRATIAAPRGAAREPLPLILSVIGGPGASWGPEPWLPDLALAAAGARMLMPDPRGSAQLRPRLAGGDRRRVGRRRRRRSARVRRLGGGGGPRRSGAPRRDGTLLRRLHGAVADRPDRPLPRGRRRRRRREPDLGRRQLRPGRRVDAAPRLGATRPPTTSASGPSPRWRTPKPSRRRS